MKVSFKAKPEARRTEYGPRMLFVHIPFLHASVQQEFPLFQVATAPINRTLDARLWREYHHHRRNRGWPHCRNAIACQWVSHRCSTVFASDATTGSSLTSSTTRSLTPTSNGPSRRSRTEATASLSGNPHLGTCTAYVIFSKFESRHAC